MANPNPTAPAGAEHTGVHPSRALIVIPQPPRRAVWLAVVVLVGRALVLPFLLPVLAVRALLAATRGAVRAVGRGLRAIGRGAWLVVRGVARGVIYAVFGSARGAWLVVRGVARGVAGAVFQLARGAWLVVGGIVRGVAGAVLGLARGAWLVVGEVARGAAGGARGIGRGAWLGVRLVVRGAVAGLLVLGRRARLAVHGAGRLALRVGVGGLGAVGHGAWLSVRGAGRLALGLARLVGRVACALNAAAEAFVRGAVAGAVWMGRSTIRFAAAMAALATFLVFATVALATNLVRAVGVALLAGVAAAAYGSFQALRICGVALLGALRVLVAVGAALGRALIGAMRLAVAAGAAVGRALAAVRRGAFGALRATGRLLVPARPGAALAVAAGAYALLAGAERVAPFLGHALVTTPAAVAALALVGFAAAALYGLVSRTIALGLLALFCVGGIRIAADVAAQGAWDGAAVASVFALFAAHAVFRFARAYVRPASTRKRPAARAHRDAGFGLVGALLGQLAVCGVWFAGLPAAERTAELATDLASVQLVVVALGGGLAVAVARGHRLRAAQAVLMTALATVLVLGVAASFQAFGQGRGATPVSLALGGLLLVGATALCLVVRARIADGSYGPLRPARAAA